VRVLAILAALILLITGYSFKLLHLPGADQLILSAVIITITVLLANTLYGYQHADGEENLFTYLHEKYSPAIECFLMLLLIPFVLYKIVTLLNSPMEYAGGIVLLVVIFGAGMQFIVLCWRTLQKDLEKRRPAILAAIISSALCFTLPFLGALIPFDIRVSIIVLFSSVSAWLAYYLDERKEITSLIVVMLPPLLFLGWALIKLNVIPVTTAGIFFNLPFMLVLLAGVFLCKKHSATRTYMIISLASYVFEYITV
jgi:hypothetical protein